MLEKIKQINDIEGQKYIVLSGLPGAGKSTVCSEFNNIGNYTVICPDDIRLKYARKEFGEDIYESEVEDLMKYDKQVWMDVKFKVLKALKNGENIIFDSTALNPKRRKQILGYISKEIEDVVKISLFLDTPVDVAIQQNINRSKTVIATRNGQDIFGRYVPITVIENMLCNTVLPSVKEDFDYIFIHHNLEEKLVLDDALNLFKDIRKDISKLDELKEKDVLKFVFPTFDLCYGVDQQNKHHKYLLHEHMIKVSQELKNESLDVFIAGLLHDVGKLITKKQYAKLIVDTDIFREGEKVEVKVQDNGFVLCRKADYKGERKELLTIKHLNIDENFHFYEHNVIGALIVRRELSMLNLSENFLDKVYFYILNHMVISKDITKKNVRRIMKGFSSEEIENLYKFYIADKISSGTSGVQDKFEETKIVIDDYLKYANNLQSLKDL